MTHRRFFCLVLILGLVFSLVGCGESAPAGISGEPSSETETEYKNFEGEGPVQGGIKSDEEIAALQEEEKMYEETSVSESEVESSEAEYVDNTGHEPESYGSGNFQDYWMGDDYFDLEDYLKANGAEKIELQSTSSITPFYNAYFDDNEWLIIVTDGSGCNIGRRDKSTPDLLNYKGWMVLPNDMENKRFVTVDEKGTTTTEETLIILDAIISCMYAHPDSDNPIENIGYRFLTW